MEQVAPGVESSSNGEDSPAAGGGAGSLESADLAASLDRDFDSSRSLTSVAASPSNNPEASEAGRAKPPEEAEADLVSPNTSVRSSTAPPAGRSVRFRDHKEAHL